MLKTTAAAIILAAGILLYFYKINGIFQFSDSCFLTGLLFCCIGLYRITRILGLFDLPIYGFKKFGEVLFNKSYKKSESALGDYSDYRLKAIYTQSAAEPLLIGSALVAASLALIRF